ncbi:MAG: hypothetical protein K2H94_08760 [Duncaniella sp.]|nr:hypothetical protein [Duncaniella sp.]
MKKHDKTALPCGSFCPSPQAWMVFLPIIIRKFASRGSAMGRVLNYFA